MQPTLRQTPPSVGYRSTSTVLMPRSAERNAAEYPPGPAPSTSMSHARSAAPSWRAAMGAVGGAACGPCRGAGPGAAAATPVVSVRMRLPSLTLSPTFTFTSFTVPAAGEGTSMDALSDSSVISGSSGFTCSPLLSATWIAAGGRDTADWHGLEFPDVRHARLHRSVDAGSGTIVGNRRAFAGRMSAFSDFLPWRDSRRRDLSLRNENERTLGHPVSDLDLDFLHHSVERRGHIHRGFVGFKCDQRILGLHPIAGADQHVDDRHFLEVADVRHLYFDVRHCFPPLHESTPHVGKEACEIDVEARRRRAVDHAMVPRQRERLNEARHCPRAVPDHLMERPARSHDGDLRRVDNWREIGAADATETRYGEGTALHLIGLELAFARELGEIAHLLSDVDHTLFVGIANDRHHEALRRVGGKPDMIVFLENEVLAVERGIKLREFLERRHRRLDHEGEHAHPHAGFLVLLVRRHPKFLELSDVGFIVAGDMRDHHPVAMQVRSRDPFDARERLRLDRAELSKVDLRPWEQIETSSCSGRCRHARLRCRCRR